MRPRKPYACKPSCETIKPVRESERGRSGRLGDVGVHECPLAETTTMHARTPDKLPDPWLFDSEKLLRELDRCREIVLLIPAPTHETHFAVNNAISAIWNLREQMLKRAEDILAKRT